MLIIGGLVVVFIVSILINISCNVMLVVVSSFFLPSLASSSIFVEEEAPHFWFVPLLLKDNCRQNDHFESGPPVKPFLPRSGSEVSNTFFFRRDGRVGEQSAVNLVFKFSSWLSPE